MENTIILLGYRDGIVADLVEKGYQIIYVVEKFRPALNDEKYYVVKCLEDAQEVLRCVLSIPINTVVGVVTGLENAVFTAALLRSVLNLPGPKDYAGTLFFRDKYLQKLKLSDVAPHANCRYVTCNSDYSILTDELGTPFIIKPANGMGSFATAAINSRLEFDDYIKKYLKDDNSVAYVVENKITATEFCVDGIWSSGKLNWFSISKYPTSPLQCNEEKLPSIQILARRDFTGLYNEIEQFCPRVLKQLNASNGVFHLEFFKNDEGVFFGECALRPAGARIPEMIKLAYGVDLYNAHTTLSMGLQYDQDLPEHPSQLFAVVLLRSFEGVPLTKEDFYNNFDLAELNWTEDKQAQSHGSHSCTGYAIIKHKEHRALEKNVSKLIAFTGAR
ncbi:ATP-grasp domain-containing protein [Serratia ureilytica]|uniref:ATP-grasp domain-containing protein n=1 Tax=Serratia ureilytica TaxID=300181 RepID=UPI0018D7817F|nr:ATP-grasp domain-containing protein [Serratia ureilytica]MBH2760547.1 ATP-grasp domain-containing protein [Serratia ureilytica]